MSVSHHNQNGLLLLLQAAKKLDEEESLNNEQSEKWEKRSTRHNYDDKYSSFSCNYNYGSQRRPVTTIRCTHNELEKSRRAHLRTCMETLKERLNFDNDVPRITMLTVLKKATATIQFLKQKKQYLEGFEDREKQRSAQLLKRCQVLKKKLGGKRTRFSNSQSWKERNRNVSECSIASSDDSEMDLRSASQSRITMPIQLSGTAATGLNACINDPSYTLSKSNKGLVSPSVGLDTFDASSSDSGFEEITITSDNKAQVLNNHSSMTYCVKERSQCNSMYPTKECRAY